MSVLIGLIVKGLLVYLVIRFLWALVAKTLKPSAGKKTDDVPKVKRFDAGNAKIDDADFTEVR